MKLIFAIIDIFILYPLWIDSLFNFKRGHPTEIWINIAELSLFLYLCKRFSCSLLCCSVWSAAARVICVRIIQIAIVDVYCVCN